jgi:hypothetical protein
MVAKDGGIFSFGDVQFHGSLPSIGVHVADVVGTAATPTNKGYWIAESDGVVHAFGDAHNFGSYAPSLCDVVTGIFSNPNAQGYRLVLQSGATIAFGSAPGGTARTGTPRSCPTPPPAPSPGPGPTIPPNPGDIKKLPRLRDLGRRERLLPEVLPRTTATSGTSTRTTMASPAKICPGAA